MGPPPPPPPPPPVQSLRGFCSYSVKVVLRVRAGTGPDSTGAVAAREQLLLIPSLLRDYVGEAASQSRDDRVGLTPKLRQTLVAGEVPN